MAVTLATVKIMARRLAIALVLLVFIVLLTVVGLLYTETGTRGVLAALEKQGMISAEGVSGSIGRGVQIKKLELLSPVEGTTVHNLSIRIRLASLFYNRLSIPAVSAKQVVITLPQTNREKAQKPLDLSFLEGRNTLLPLEISIENLSIEALQLVKYQPESQQLESQQLNKSEEPVIVRNIQLAAFANERSIHIRNLQLAYNNLSVELNGRYTSWPKLAGKATLQWHLTLPEQEEINGKGQLTANREQVTLLHSTSGKVVSQSRLSIYNWLETPEIALESTLEKLQWEFADNGVLANRELEVSSINLKAEGDLKSLAIALSGDALLDGKTVTNIQLSGQIDQNSLNVNQARFSNQSGAAEFTGLLSWPENNLHWLGELNLIDYNLASVIEHMPEKLSGNLSVEGSITNQLFLDIQSHQLRGTHNGYPFSLALNSTVAGEQVTVRQLLVNVADNNIHIHGNYHPENMDLAFDVLVTDAGQIYPELQGALGSKGTLQGSLEQPVINVSGNGEALSWRKLYVEHIDFELAVDKGNISGPNNQLILENPRYGQQTFERVSVIPEGNWKTPGLSIAVNTAEMEINTVASIQKILPSTEFTLSDSELTLDQIGTWRQEKTVNITVQPDNWYLSPFCMVKTTSLTASRTGKNCISANKTASVMSLNLDIQNLPLNLIYQLGLSPYPMQGEVDLLADVSGTLDDLNGQAHLAQSKNSSEITLTSIGSEMFKININQPEVDVSVTHSKLTGSLSAGLHEQGSLQGNLRIDKLFDPDSSISGRFDYQLPDLSPYQNFIPDLEQLTGKLNGSLEVKNTLGNPQFLSTMKLDIPELAIAPLATDWKNVTLTVNSQTVDEHHLNMTMHAGDGSIEAAGRLRLLPQNDWIASLSVTGENALLSGLPHRKIIASPDISVEATPQLIALTGKLVVTEAMLEVANQGSRLSLTSDAVIHYTDAETTTGDSLPPVSMNLQVILGNQVNLSAYGLNTRLGGELALRQNKNRPLTTQGELQLQDGYYRAYGQDLTITRGVIQLAGSPDNPRIILTASRKIDDITAGLHVNGQVNNLQTTLFSKPAMRDAEILSYIIRGKPLSDTSAADKSALTNAALSYAIGKSAPVTDKLSELTGLDEIGLEAEQGIESVGLTLGKHLTPELYVRYGLDVVERISKLLVSYQLTNRLFLETETGKGQSVDLIYRVQ